MEKFYLEKPNLKRKNEIIEYVNELILYHSDINGIELLIKILNGYSFAQTLEFCLNMELVEYAKKMGKTPVKTFLLIRENDDKIVGAINIRWDPLIKNHAYIGYGIRPTERRRGYNKINLYLGLKEAKKMNFKTIILNCETCNLGSIKTIEALSGHLIKEEIDPFDGLLTRTYCLEVNQTIDQYKHIFEKQIHHKL